MPAIGIGLGIGRLKELSSLRLIGTPFPGETLTARNAGQWYLDGAPITGETGDTYTVDVRDIGKVLRCGSSRPVTVWHPRDEASVRACYVPWEGVYNAVGPDVPAEPGQTVRRWVDIVSGIPVDQTTGNAQPMLGYVEPPPGNMVWFSEPVYTGDIATGWMKNSDVSVSAGSAGQFGESTLVVDATNLSASTQPVVSVRNTSTSGVIIRYAWVYSEEPIRVKLHGSLDRPYTQVDGWTLVTTTIPSAPTLNFLGFYIHPDDVAIPFTIGRTWAVVDTWNQGYTPTNGSPVIPDTTDLLRALVFDGDNDVLASTYGGLLRKRKAVALVAACIDTDPSGGTAEHLPFLDRYVSNAGRGVLYTKHASEGVINGVGFRTGAVGVFYLNSNSPAAGGARVLYGDLDLNENTSNLYRDGILINSRAIPSVATTDDVDGAGITIGSGFASNSRFPGRIAAIMVLADDINSITALTRNRINQFAGLCVGKDLGLPVS